MQNFQDTSTGDYYAFDDDVVVTETAGGLTFHTASGGQLNAPSTLAPVDEIPNPEPKIAVPAAVTKYQACVVLARHDLLGQVNDFFGGLAADDPRRLAWEMAATVQRHSESTTAAIAHLGLTEEQADAMFVEGAAVE